MPTNYNGYTVPEPTDIADAPAAFEEFSDSIPFNEYVAIESLSADTTVVDSYNGKMIFATADLTLTFGTLTDGFSVAVTADTGVTVDYLGVDKASQQTTAYQVASVVAVNGTNIISIAGGACPPCPPCPPAGTPEATISAITGSGTTHTYGSYIAYEFKTSGTITCTEGTVSDALIVGGGGGGGGSFYAGGGGAGGYTNITDAFLSAATHGVIIGEGGIGGVAQSDSAGTGSASLLGSYAGLGGGIGATYGDAGGDGGSGGGDSFNNSGGGSSLGGQGNKGGNGFSGCGAGGGGSAAAGGDASTANVATAGGAGASSSITGSAVNRAGGGGGGATAPAAGGSGGGGDGTASGTGNAGTANTGGGGGGSSTVSGVGGEGGSGVVIVKVLATNASSVDTTGWIEVTAAMLAAAEKKRKAEVKKLEKKMALEAKNEELSGQTNKTDIKETK